VANYSEISRADSGNSYRNSNNNGIDLRSDTVTLPSDAMKAAMMSAKLGDDVYGEDATVNKLQQRASSLFDKESALFFPSGTQSNLAALLAHCQRGEEVIVGSSYHIYQHEAHGASVLGGLALYPVQTDSHGTFSIDDLKTAIKVDDFHYAVSKLLCLENTVSGQIQPQNHIEALSATAHENGLAVHMDGARIFNAHIHSNVALSELTQTCDSVSVCLSKGLGSPAGSLLLGDRSFIDRAVRIRKLLGGAMRQAGILAAGGLYALQHNIKRMQADDQRAERLAQDLTKIAELSVQYDEQQTNMVFVHFPESSRTELQVYLRGHDILIESPGDQTRMVCHLGISDADIERVVDVLASFYRH
jgi:threonine aldolase